MVRYVVMMSPVGSLYGLHQQWDDSRGCDSRKDASFHVYASCFVDVVKLVVIPYLLSGLLTWLLLPSL